MVSWDILVCSIVHRTMQLRALLDEIDLQRVPGVGVRVFRDNLEAGYGEKCRTLLGSSSAEYVCFADDDDMIAPDYVASIVKVLEQRPDYVGFDVRYTEDGVRQVPVTHSLQHHGWENLPDRLTRDIVHFNPIRRDIALRGEWAGGNGADARWAAQVRGIPRTEVYVPRELYWYQHTTHDTFCAPRTPLSDPPERPEAPWVTWLS